VTRGRLDVVTRWKQSVRAAVDRFLKPYFDLLADDVHSVRNSTQARFDELATRLDSLGAGLAGTDARLDDLGTRLAGTDARLDDLGTRLAGTDARLDARLDDLGARLAGTEERLVYHHEGHAQRQAELREGLDAEKAALEAATQSLTKFKPAMEDLELLFMAQLEGLFGAVNNEAAALRSDVAELTRMLRMQGDAADQVAEVLGRTLTRLSSELEALGGTIEMLQARGEGAPSPA